MKEFSFVAVLVGCLLGGGALAEVFPEGTTTVDDARTYATGEELALTNAAGATLHVVTGGSIAYDAGSLSDATTPVLTIGPDSELKLTGSGSMTFTDFAGLVSAGGTEDRPARITIGDTGSLKFVATRSSGMYLLGSIVLNPHSELDVSGSGVFETSDSVSGYATPRHAMFHMAGGSVRFRENATFKMGDVTDLAYQFQRGTAVFSDSSVWDFMSGTRVLSDVQIGCRGSAGESVEVIFRDHARMRTGTTLEQPAFNVPTRLRLANPSKGTWTYFRHHSDQVLSLGAICLVGVASTGNSWAGGATYEQTSGYARVGGNHGLHVAHVADGLTQVCTGIVTVADCGLFVRASQGANGSFTGLIVGRGPAIDDKKTYAFAEMRISGTACVTNECGYIAIGTGRATAKVVQTGGSLYSVTSAGRPMAIGLAGGTGAYALSNGVIRLNSDLYVGGAPVATSHAGVNWRGATGDGTGFGVSEDYTIGGAVGSLVVAAADTSKDCKVILDRKSDSFPGFVRVGANGTGTLEIGEGGHVNCRGLELSGPAATLKFTLGKTGGCPADEDAFLRIKAMAGSTGSDGGLLSIGAGAKIVVDARRYDGSEKWVLLALPNRREGTFAEKDITVLGGGSVVHDRPGYEDPNGRSGLLWYRRGRRGLTVFVK